jgi:predicted permease
VRSAIYLQSVTPGFDGIGVLTARVSLPLTGYEEPARVEQTFREIAEQLAQSPGVSAAAVSSNVPMGSDGSNNGLVPEGKTFDPDDFVLGRLGVVSDGYFRSLRIRVVAGRAFTSADRRDTERVMLLSETAARQLFPHADAIGKRVACCEAGPDGLPTLKLVVGIVGDVRTDGPQQPARADFYLPIAQAPSDAWTWLQRTLTVVVRSQTGDPARAATTIRSAVRRVAPAAATFSIATMPQRRDATLARDRFNTVLMLILGGIGLVLSTVGIFGVTSCLVTQRQRELAIRAALGARVRDLVLMVLSQGLRPVWLGVLVGVPLSASLSRTLSSYVYGVTIHDPLTFALAVSLLIGAAIVANIVPARAAANLPPATLLGA